MNNKTLFSILALFALVISFVCALIAPRETLNVLLPVAAIMAAVLIAAQTTRTLRRGSHLEAMNTLSANTGTSENSRRYKATAALATANLFVKAGADDEHIAAITATADKPIGVISDEADAAEDPIDVQIPGAINRTVTCVAGAAIATLDLDMYTDAAGKVVGKPTAAGTYWKVGTNLTLAEAANDPVEVKLCTPEKLTVIAALTSTNGTAAAAVPGALTSTNGTAAAAIPGALTSTNGTAAAAIPGALTSTDGTAAAASADLAALAAEAEKIGDDTRAIHAAFLLLAAEVEKIGDDVRAVHAADLLAQAETEKIGDDARAIHAAALLAQAETEKIGDDVRSIAAGLNAAGVPVALATT